MPQYEKETFIGAGTVRANGFIIGNVMTMSHAVAIEEKSIPARAAGGGDYDALSLISAVTLSLEVSDFNDENLALALQASKIDITATEKTENITAVLGGVVSLDCIVDVDVAVSVESTDSTPVAFDVGTDFEMTPFGIEVLKGGAITDAQALNVTYTPKAGTALEAYAAQPKELQITAEVINEATGTPFQVQYHKFKPSPTADFAVFSDDFGTLSLSGPVLADNSKGAGRSKFMRLVKMKSLES